MPFVRVDSQSDVAFHILDATDISSHLPRELIVRTPCCTHTEKGSVCDRLRVSCDTIVGFGCQVYVLRAETGKDIGD